MTENTEAKNVIKVEKDKTLSEINKKMYKDPVKTETKTVNYSNGKTKVIETLTYKNGVVKNKVKEVKKGNKRIG